MRQELGVVVYPDGSLAMISRVVRKYGFDVEAVFTPIQRKDIPVPPQQVIPGF